VSPNFQMWQN